MGALENLLNTIFGEPSKKRLSPGYVGGKKASEMGPPSDTKSGSLTAPSKTAQGEGHGQLLSPHAKVPTPTSKEPTPPPVGRAPEEDTKYTLLEARQKIKEQECYRNGHSWDVWENWYGPDIIKCSNCDKTHKINQKEEQQ